MPGIDFIRSLKGPGVNRVATGASDPVPPKADSGVAAAGEGQPSPAKQEPVTSPVLTPAAEAVKAVAAAGEGQPSPAKQEPVASPVLTPAVEAVKPVAAAGEGQPPPAKQEPQDTTSALARMPSRKPGEPAQRVQTSLTPLSATAAASKEAQAAPADVRCTLCSDKQYVLYAQGDSCRAKVCQCRPPCELCRDRGFWLEYLPTGYQVYHDCPCRKLPRRLEIFNRAKIPPHFLKKDLTNLDTTQRSSLVLSLETVTKYAKSYPENRNGLLIVGEPGMGKTHLMVGLIKVLTLEKGVPCLFKDFLLLLRDLREAWQSQQSDIHIIRPLMEIEVLVIDELGKARSNSDWEQAVLDEIISTRYNTDKTTYFTTNYPIDLPRDELRGDDGATSSTAGSFKARNLTDPSFRETLEQRVGFRIYSRICHQCTILQLYGADYRRINKGTAIES